MRSFFLFNDTATPEIYTLSLHDALPILERTRRGRGRDRVRDTRRRDRHRAAQPLMRSVLKFGGTSELQEDRKSTRLNSSHTVISYAVFCLKKKKNIREEQLAEIT